VLTGPPTSLFSLLLRHFQPFSTPQTIHPRIAHLPAVTTQQTTDPAVAETRTLSNQLQHRLHQSRFVFAWLRFVTLRAAWLIQHLTSTTFRNIKVLLKLLHGSTLSRRAYQF